MGSISGVKLLSEVLYDARKAPTILESIKVIEMQIYPVTTYT